jgi:hypothetical protein
LIKAGLSKDDRGFLLPLAEHPWHRQCTQSYCIEVSLGDGRRLIIPCMELIRFDFGSSSGLISKLFLPPLSKDALYSDAKFDRASGRLTIKLADKISGASASDIGRLFLNSHAWRSAVAVGTSLLKGAAAGQQIFPQAFFPFEGTTDLVAAGKWISFAGSLNSTFVVFNLRSCSHPFPFSSLQYEVPDTGQRANHGGHSDRAIRHTGTPENSDRATRSTGTPDSQNQTLVERDASNRLSVKTQPIWLEQRFPDLTRKPVWKSKVLVDTDAAPESASSMSSHVTEAAVGDSGSEQRIRPINLAIAVSKDRHPPDFLRDIVGELRKLQQTEVTLLTAGEGDGWTVSIPILYDDDGKIDPRLFGEVQGGNTRLRSLSAFRLRPQDNLDVFLVVIEAVPVYARFQLVSEDDDIWRVIDLAGRLFLHRHPDANYIGFKRGLEMAFGPLGAFLGPLVLALEPESEQTAATIFQA